MYVYICTTKTYVHVYDSEHSVGYVNAHYRQLVSIYNAIAMCLYHITTKTTEALIGTPLESVHHWHSYKVATLALPEWLLSVGTCTRPHV